MNIIEAMESPRVFEKMFRKKGLFRKSDTWASWKIFLRALFALPLDDEQRELYRKHTGRDRAPAEPSKEAYLIVGRRGGKSLAAALIATFLAAFRDYSHVLNEGEIGTLMVIASDRRQARVIFSYVKAFFRIPMLKGLVLSELKESLTLSNHIAIEIHTSSFKATRGYSLIGVIADEISFWESELSANPAGEVLTAVRPGLATTGGLLLAISSPYSKTGPLYENYREHYGKSDSPVLVWKATSREMNPTLPAEVVERALARDRVAASAEYLAEFRDDIGGFLSVEEIERCIISGRTLLPRISGVSYRAFVDPSGGRQDSMTLAVAHGEGDRVVLDLLREAKAPFSPREIVHEFAGILKSYRCSEICGDKYSAEWVSESFEKEGVRYIPSEKNRSELYLEFLPALTSGQIELLDNDRMKQQFASLQRRAGPARDSVDHPGHGHDDLSNSVAGAVCKVLESLSLGQYGVLDLARKYMSDIAANIRDEFGELLRKPEPQPTAAEAKPAETRVDNFEIWLRTHRAPPCPACENPSTVYRSRDELLCNQCGAVNGIPRPKPIENDLCPKCGLKMHWSGGGLYCQNDGQPPATELVGPRVGFAYLNARRNRFR
jgi:hypothetical protein